MPSRPTDNTSGTDEPPVQTESTIIQDNVLDHSFLADISDCTDKKRLALLRSHVSERCVADQPVCVMAVGTDTNRKTSARKSLYRGSIPGKMVITRFNLSNDEYCFVKS